jgi:hypothetical protein
MKITIESASNGIHDYLNINIENPKVKELNTLKDILVVVERYNNLQIQQA